MHMLQKIEKKTGVSLQEDDFESVFSMEDKPFKTIICAIQAFPETSDTDWSSEPDPNDGLHFFS